MKKEIPILMYHQFINERKKNTSIETFVTGKQFERHLKLLKLLGYETITFKDLEKIKLENRFKKKYIIITVDDGYKNNYEVMFPLLKKYKMKAVIFLVSDLKYNEWDVKKFNEEKIMLMDDFQINDMINSGLIEFGGHTSTHCDFHLIKLDKAINEIKKNKEYLEEKYNIKLVSFAYPYGHLNREVKNIVKDVGYKFAVATDSGSGYIPDDLYEIRRTAIDKTSIFDFMRKISFNYSIYKGKKWKKRKKNE